MTNLTKDCASACTWNRVVNEHAAIIRMLSAVMGRFVPLKSSDFSNLREPWEIYGLTSALQLVDDTHEFDQTLPRQLHLQQALLDFGLNRQ